MIEDRRWGSNPMVNDAWERVAVQGTDSIALDFKTLFGTVGDHGCNIIPGQSQVVDPVESINEATKVSVSVVIKLDPILIRIVA